MIFRGTKLRRKIYLSKKALEKNSVWNFRRALLRPSKKNYKNMELTLPKIIKIKISLDSTLLNPKSIQKLKNLKNLTKSSS
jgi:hypothetical protein